MTARKKKAPALPLGHEFREHPWGKDICDRKLDDGGRIRTCCRPRREHQP